MYETDIGEEQCPYCGHPCPMKAIIQRERGVIEIYCKPTGKWVRSELIYSEKRLNINHPPTA